MAYPSKTDRESILAVAIEQLSTVGLRGMSLRSIAAQLGIAPNALYRYFTDRASLEAALSAEGARLLLAALRKAAGRKAPEAAIKAMASAYMRFAREQSAIYEVLMMRCALSEQDAQAHQQLWLFVVEYVSQLTPDTASGSAKASEASVALWAFLRGMAALEGAQIFSEEKPLSSFQFGMNAWLAAVMSS